MLKLATVAGVGVLIGDAVSNKLGQPGYDIEEVTGSRQADVLNVLHPGIFSVARLQTLALESRGFSPASHILDVGPSPDSKHYDADTHVEITVDAVERLARKYPALTRVALNGISMGGPTMLDTANELARVGAPERYEFGMSLTLLDSPAVWGDVNVPPILDKRLVAMAARYPAGRVINAARRGVGFDWLNEDATKDVFGEGADMELWKTMQSTGNQMATSLVLDQLHSIASRKPLSVGDFAALRSVVFVGSENDELINHDSAKAQWSLSADAGAAYGETTVPGAPHGALANFKSDYQAAFRRADAFHEDAAA